MRYCIFSVKDKITYPNNLQKLDCDSRVCGGSKVILSPFSSVQYGYKMRKKINNI